MNGEASDSEDEREPETGVGLMISKEKANRNYKIAGTLVDEPPDEISLAKHEHLLNDALHGLIMEVLQETKLPFKLADFQMISLHVLGSGRNLVLISPTGSGKMLGKSSLINNTISVLYIFKS